MKKLREKFDSLSNTKKAQAILAAILTASIVASLPVLAWFTHQRKVATVAKINSPATLVINAGKAEDIAQFKIPALDVGEGENAGSERFVFGVEGEDVSSYKLQLARTTNLKLTYTLYRAHTDSNATAKDINHAEYIDVSGAKVYYVKAENLTATNGTYINLDDQTVSGRSVGSTNYVDQNGEKSYNNADKRQRFAEPLYWQTTNPLQAKAVDADANDVSYDEYEAVYGKKEDKKFLNFYILEVSWNAGDVTNDKETDIVYITAQVN